MTSTFSAEQFIGTTTEEVGSTKYIQVPEGEYVGQVKEVRSRQFQGKTGETFTVIELEWLFTDPAVVESTGLEHPTARQTVFVDLKENNALDFGKNKNVPLSRLREAVGQQRNGKPWGPAHLSGAQAICLVVHEVDQNGDPRAVVKRVAPLNAPRTQGGEPGGARRPTRNVAA